MNNISSPKGIRQQQPGMFRRQEDGEEPFVHVQDGKVDSARAHNTRSVYVEGGRVLTFEKGMLETDFPQLFDHDAGLKLKPAKMKGTHNETKEIPRKAKEEPQRSAADKARLVDDWA